MTSDTMCPRTPLNRLLVGSLLLIAITLSPSSVITTDGEPLRFDQLGASVLVIETNVSRAEVADALFAPWSPTDRLPRVYRGWGLGGVYGGPTGPWVNERAEWPNRLVLKLLQVLLGIPDSDTRVVISSDEGVHETIELKALQVRNQDAESKRRSAILSVNARWIVGYGSSGKAYEDILMWLLSARGIGSKGYPSKRLLVDKWWVQRAYRHEDSRITLYILTPWSVRVVDNLEIRCYPLEDD